jgi:subtilase family protein
MDVDGALSDLEPLLMAWRTEQAGDARDSRVRFVLNFATPPPDAQTQRLVESRLGLRVTVGPLFAPDPDLDRFRLLVVPEVSRPDRADLFELAAALRDLVGAETVEPDAGTDYFTEPDQPPPPGAPESADWVFWCWVDPIQQAPTEPDWAVMKTWIPEAWAFSQAQGKTAKGEGAVIFQPDTGVVPEHVEVPPHAHAHPSAANFVEVGQQPIDPMTGGGNPGHGTGTCSVAASPEDGRIRGAAPKATLVPIRCIETVAVFDQSPVAQAIDHARRNGAHVITMSLGGIFSVALHAAVRKAVNANVIVVAAAGNCTFEVVWPARYDEVIAVAGVNEASVPWRGSCRGPAVDISGPAELVLRADPKAAHDPHHAVSGGQGTSFATALLAGVAALWLAHHGRDALIQAVPAGRRLQDLFKHMVQRTATVPPNFDVEEYGAGIVNALGLLQADPFHVGGLEAALSAPVSADERAGVEELLRRVYGEGAVEAAGPALTDPQFAPELACLAFDRLRAHRTRRAHLEALPPHEVSPALRRRMQNLSPMLADASSTGDD